jgi:molybdopterin adenylyltransferase
VNMFNIGIITASDGTAGKCEDISGQTIATMLQEMGHVAAYVIVPDDKEQLAAELIHMADELKFDLILTTGGTGLGPQDATLAVIDHEVPGIAEAMRAKTLKFTPQIQLCRAKAGLHHKTLIINLPGSPKGIQECLQVMLPALEQGLAIMKN